MGMQLYGQTAEGVDTVYPVTTSENVKRLDGTTVEEAIGELEQKTAYHAALSFAAELPAGGWSSDAPYTQTVPVDGLFATDDPLVDVVLSDDSETAIAQLEAYGYIGRMDALDGVITAYCYEDKPEVSLNIQLKVVR